MKKVLIWTDSALTPTGYGTITRNIFNTLQRTGLYEITHVAINYFGDSYSGKEVPWKMIPASASDKSDPYGRKTFLEVLKKENYDLVWIMNDYQIVHPVINQLKIIAEERKKDSMFKSVFYCPIDIEMPELNTSFFDVFDRVVAYCNFGKKQILNLASRTEEKISVINPGVDLNKIKVISASERQIARKKYFNIDSDNTFLIINVNRNTYRKQFGSAIQAFSVFKKNVPDTRLYLHTSMFDRISDIDLEIAVRVLNLSPHTEVIYPLNFDLLNAFSVEELNQIYNSADCFLTTSLGEGWGLTHLDAMAVNVPVVAPDNTSFTEQLDGGSRGILYPCKEKIFIDNAGYRPFARNEDIVNGLKEAFKLITGSRDAGIPRSEIPLLAAAKRYTDSLSWEIIGQQWLSMISGLLR